MRKIVVSSSLGIALAVSAVVIVQTAKSEPQTNTKTAKILAGAVVGHGNADSITEEELKVYLNFLASDQLEGRNLPSRGYDIAALYIASHLAEWGLRPGGSTTNTNGPLQPYLMPIELISRQVVPAESKASLTAPVLRGRGGRGAGAAGRGGAGSGMAESASPRPVEFEYGKDWTTSAGGRGAPPLAPFDVTGNLVFAGNGYVVNKTNANPYEGLDVRGKIVVVAGLPPELAAQQAAAGAGRGGRGGGRGAASNPLGQSCSDFLTPEEYAAKNGALAVVTIANYQQLTAMANPNAGGGFFGPGRGRSAERPRLPGAEAAAAAGLRKCTLRNRWPGDDQRYFPR